MAKVAGTKIGANETMWKGEEVNILKRISTQPILKSDGWSWDSHRNARGDQSYFSNAGLALVMLLTAGPGGIVHLIQGLIGKAGHSNHLPWWLEWLEWPAFPIPVTQGDFRPGPPFAHIPDSATYPR